MIIYQLLLTPNQVIKDGYMAIPFDPANKDYIAYLAWLSEGNTPTPAEEQGA
jgi:hypothetical protein